MQKKDKNGVKSPLKLLIKHCESITCKFQERPKTFIEQNLNRLLSFLIIGCKPEKPDGSAEFKVFQLLPSEKTHVDFQNTIEETPSANLLLYEYFYNGGGVATGDLNGDGLEDLYFTSNMGANKLYLNKGGLQFADITTKAGVAGREGPGEQV